MSSAPACLGNAWIVQTTTLRPPAGLCCQLLACKGPGTSKLAQTFHPGIINSFRSKLHDLSILLVETQFPCWSYPESFFTTFLERSKLPSAGKSASKRFYKSWNSYKVSRTFLPTLLERSSRFQSWQNVSKLRYVSKSSLKLIEKILSTFPERRGRFQTGKNVSRLP